MTCLGMWTADLQDLSVQGAAPYVEISSEYARTGTYSFRLLSTVDLIFPFRTPASTFYGRACVRNTGKIRFYTASSSINTPTVYLYIMNGYIGVYNFSTLLTEGTYMPQQWNCIEFKVVVDDSSGEVVVKINGEEVINATGIDTQYHATETNVVKMYCGQIGNTYWDDICLYTDQWPGTGGIHVLKPNAGSTNENWTASAGDPEACVDDLPVSYTDYIYTAGNTPDTEHLYGIESLPAAAISVKGVAVMCNAKLDQNSDAQLRTLFKSGTTTDTGTAYSLSTTESWIQETYQTNPDDAAVFENADIDALEIGVETQ